MGYNFTPSRGEYTELKPFRFWCQKVLPLVYDESLSYYELLSKVVDYLNKTMEDVETLEGDVTSLYSAFNTLQSFVNGYFDNLDVQDEINNKLDEMAEDGTLNTLISDKLLVNFVTSVNLVERNVQHKNRQQIDTYMGQGIFCFPESDNIITSLCMPATAENQKILLTEFTLGTNNIIRTKELNIGHGNCFTYKDGFLYTVDSYDFKVYKLDYQSLNIVDSYDFTNVIEGMTALATCQYDPFTDKWYISALIENRRSVPLYEWEYWTDNIEEINLPETDQTLWGRQGWYVYNNFVYGLYSNAYTISVYDLRTMKLVKNISVQPQEYLYKGDVREIESICPVSHTNEMCDFVILDTGQDCNGSNYYTTRTSIMNMYKNMVDQFQDTYVDTYEDKIVSYKTDNIIEYGTMQHPFVSLFSYNGDKRNGAGKMLLICPANNANIGGLSASNKDYCIQIIEGELYFSRLYLKDTRLSIHGAVHHETTSVEPEVIWKTNNSDIYFQNYSVNRRFNALIAGCNIRLTNNNNSFALPFLFNSNSTVITSQFDIVGGQNIGTYQLDNFNRGNRIRSIFTMTPNGTVNQYVITKFTIYAFIDNKAYTGVYFKAGEQLSSTDIIPLFGNGNYEASYYAKFVNDTTNFLTTISIVDGSGNLINTNFRVLLER